MRISDWSSDVCSSDLVIAGPWVKLDCLRAWDGNPGNVAFGLVVPLRNEVFELHLPGREERAERLAQVLPLGTEGSVKLLSGLAVEWPSVALYLAAKALNAPLQLHGLTRDTLVHEVAIESQVHPDVLKARTSTRLTS